MSFDLPASVEREIERYAQAAHISPAEAAVKFIQSGLRAQRRKAATTELTESEWQELLEADPAFAFFAKMPESAIDCIGEASRQTRAERFTPRA